MRRAHSRLSAPEGMTGLLTIRNMPITCGLGAKGPSAHGSQYTVQSTYKLVFHTCGNGPFTVLRGQPRCLMPRLCSSARRWHPNEEVLLGPNPAADFPGLNCRAIVARHVPLPLPYLEPGPPPPPTEAPPHPGSSEALLNLPSYRTPHPTHRP